MLDVRREKATKKRQSMEVIRGRPQSADNRKRESQRPENVDEEEDGRKTKSQEGETNSPRVGAGI